MTGLAVTETCAVEGCARSVVARGFCNMHYQRVRRNGSPGVPGVKNRAGAGNSRWIGGRARGGHKQQYWQRYLPDHPAASKAGYVLEHRLVMEGLLGRRLEAKEIVHHINGDSLDNRPENLQVMTQGQHMREHALHRKRWAS